MRTLQQLVLGDLTLCRSLSVEARSALFRDPPRGTIADRWHVYAHGYLARILEALSGEYRALARILGPDPFAALVHRYLSACPPRSFDLGCAGDRMASYLPADPITADLPFLPDLARLERCISEAFVAADSEPLTWSALRLGDPLEILEQPFVARPGAALVRSQWPIHDLFAVHDQADEDVSVEVRDRPARVLVHRVVFSVRVNALDSRRAEIVEQALEGPTTLAALYEKLGGLDDDSFAMSDLITAFRDLVDLEVLTTCAAPSLKTERRIGEDLP